MKKNMKSKFIVEKNFQFKIRNYVKRKGKKETIQ